MRIFLGFIYLVIYAGIFFASIFVMLVIVFLPAVLAQIDDEWRWYFLYLPHLLYIIGSLYKRK